MSASTRASPSLATSRPNSNEFPLVPVFGRKKRVPVALSSFTADGRGRRDGLMLGRVASWLDLSSAAEVSMVAIFVLVSFFIDLSFIEFTALQKTVVPFADHLLFGVVRDKEAARVEFGAPVLH